MAAKSTGIDMEQNYVTVTMHRVTMTLCRSLSMPAGIRRHVVGKTQRNVCYCDIA